MRPEPTIEAASIVVTGVARYGNRVALRCLTYLAPGIPLGFFEGVVRFLGSRIGVEASLEAETAVSGPPEDGCDPFSTGRVDVGFVCSPSYVRMARQSPAVVELVPVAPLFADSRLGGRPGYFSEIVVRRGSTATGVEDLRAKQWAYNDRCSMSGYWNALARLGLGAEQFERRAVASGSHFASLSMIARGEVEAAAIDSNVLRTALRAEPELDRCVRVVESIGPCAPQPIVARPGLLGRFPIGALLSTMHQDPAGRVVLEEYGVEGFRPVRDCDYDRERSVLR